ncbi:MAG: PEP-CTERM sorting domain-containing protein [Candidatus Marinimicrobia bacterium]|nr:PEP-CTERM sorting domain-containing protein [Candidatus Neomarinimicrobiota bacterium]
MQLVDDGLLTTNRVRITVVMNQSGGGIALPGSLGTLNANTLGMYFRKADGSYGATLSTQAINADKTAAGFGIQQTVYTLESSAYFDNFGAWDSVGDTVGSTGVLELGFGAVIPEPTTLLLLGLGSLGLWIRRQMRARA